MRRCRGCGGVLGVDCWNEQDCMWITADMERAGRQAAHRAEIDAYEAAYAAHLTDLEAEHLESLARVVGGLSSGQEAK